MRVIHFTKPPPGVQVVIVATTVFLTLYTIANNTGDQQHFAPQSQQTGQSKKNNDYKRHIHERYNWTEKYVVNKRFLSDLYGYDPGRIWYSHRFQTDDRIVAQLRYRYRRKAKSRKVTRILVTGDFAQGKVLGRDPFLEDKCNINDCFLTANLSEERTADVVMVDHTFTGIMMRRPITNQIRIVYLSESPHFRYPMDHLPNDSFNWTASYRHDSTLVAPYAKFMPYNVSIFRKRQFKNYAMGKTKKVAWFVSNCQAHERLKYANELKKYIDVDIYGNCGSLECPIHSKDETCFKKLSRDYKFYLSFENSNCRDYITEKFFLNGLSNDVVPVAMGAHPDDYRRVSPPHSYIHVDDFLSPRELANYLHYLDQNDEEYNKYFEWKGTGVFINTKLMCRVCAMVHAADSEHHLETVNNLSSWWNKLDICVKGRWTKS